MYLNFGNEEVFCEFSASVRLTLGKSVWEMSAQGCCSVRKITQCIIISAKQIEKKIKTTKVNSELQCGVAYKSSTAL